GNRDQRAAAAARAAGVRAGAGIPVRLAGQRGDAAGVAWPRGRAGRGQVSGVIGQRPPPTPDAGTGPGGLAGAVSPPVGVLVDAVITADQRGRIAGFNPAAERIFGWSAREVW